MNRRSVLNWCAAMVVVPCLDWTVRMQPRTLPEAFEAQFEETILGMAQHMGFTGIHSEVIAP